MTDNYLPKNLSKKAPILPPTVATPAVTAEPPPTMLPVAPIAWHVATSPPAATPPPLATVHRLSYLKDGKGGP